MPQTPPNSGDMIPSTLGRPGAERFWLAILLTGVGTGIGAAAMTRLLDAVQHFMWPGSGTDLLSAAEQASAWHHILVRSAQDSSLARDRSS
jgi:CIC family chloride channel protein